MLGIAYDLSNSAILNRILPFSMTINDPEPRFKGHDIIRRWMSQHNNNNNNNTTTYKAPPSWIYRLCEFGYFGKMSITPDWIKISAPNFTGTVEASNFTFGTQLGFGTSLPKNNVLDQNWRGSGPGQHPKKLGPPTYFCNRWSLQLQIWYTNWVWH